ncbi:hypothetical protein GCM10010425_49400 [Streptomyces spororaveus]|uniref:Uncharacterized protein n=1 Tax=Streptomyces spororaveus TaxID=284039 RepID=A0ABQ3T2B7_9ACTN|nr:hypothetical protein Sspor_00950 [Streptomyces spororaveus]
MPAQQSVVPTLSLEDLGEIGEIELAGGAVDSASDPEPVRDADLVVVRRPGPVNVVCGARPLCHASAACVAGTLPWSLPGLTEVGDCT